MTGEQVWGIIRTILAALGGFVTGKGWLDEQTFTAVLGALGTLFVAGWSVVRKTPKAVVAQAAAVVPVSDASQAKVGIMEPVKPKV